MRNLNNRCTTENIDITSLMDSINIIGRINALNSSSGRNDSIRTHSGDELRASKNYSALAISTNNAN